MEKGDEAPAVSLSEQGVELSNRVEISDDDLDAVAGSLNLKKSRRGSKSKKHRISHRRGKAGLKNCFDKVEKVVHDTFYIQ